MKTSQTFGAAWLVLALLTSVAYADTRADDQAVRRALNEELARSRDQLVIAGEPRPYYLAYQLLDTSGVHLSANLGSVALSQPLQVRNLLMTLRVGDANFDSSMPDTPGAVSLMPLDDDTLALRQQLWRSSDTAYKAAVEALAHKKNLARTRMAEAEEDVPEFSPSPAHQTTVKVSELDLPAAEKRLREIVTRLSAVAKEYENLHDAGAEGSAHRSRQRLLTSEGTWVDHGAVFSRVSFEAETQAADGMMLSLGFSVTGTALEQLPAADEVVARARSVIDHLMAARQAPLAENGTAVVLFEGEAAAQLIGALLVDGLNGTPPPKFSPVDSDSSLASKLGLLVTSPLLDIYDDPTATSVAGVPLWGHYVADDEGVPARRVSLVERGVLKTLLMSRTPRKEIRESNGHARGQGVTIGNLFVTGRNRQPRARLLSTAIAKARALDGQGASVYVVRRLGSQYSMGGGGFAMALARMMGFEPPLYAAAGLLAIEAYRLVGGKEQPVRGLILERLDLRTLKDIAAIGDQSVVFNQGQRTARTSIISPSLLITGVDVKRFSGRNPKLPSYRAPQAAIGR